MTDDLIKLLPLVERPLVTFALFAYNQEKFIREAVEGAFAQTYEPLEIILSDDCSTDRTFEIIKEIASNYHGNKRVITNQNPKNLGISDHVRFIHEKSNGDIVVHAAGDDISVPNRTEVIVKAFLDDDFQPSLVTSNVLNIDEKGFPYKIQDKQIRDLIVENHGNPFEVLTPVNGAAVAIKRELISSFTPPVAGIITEDQVLQSRAMLLNGKKFIPETLVKYRICGEGTFNFRTRSRSEYLNYLLRWQLDYEKRLLQLTQDINHRKLPVEKFSKDIELKTKYIRVNERVLRDSFFLSMKSMILLIIFYKSMVQPKAVLFKFILRWFPTLVNYKK
jgi:glycosyltransferase involved in cell wall biosynthesis